MFVRVTSGYIFAWLNSARLVFQPEFSFSIEAFIWLTMAFKDFTLGKTLFTAEWVGFKHFEAFLQDPYFWNLIWNTLALNLLLLLFSFPAPILLALMTNEMRGKTSKKLVQSISYLRIIKTILKGVVLIISPFLEKLYCRSSYLLYNQNKHCGFVIWLLQLRLFGGDSNRSGLSELVISWVTLDVLFA